MSERRFEYYPSTKSSLRTHEGTVLLLPGLLGERTMQESVAVPLAQEGFNTLVVTHSRKNSFHECNLARSKDVHKAAQQAIGETGCRTIHIIAHSKGGEDAANFMEFMHDPPEDKDISYQVHGYGAIATVGRNGFNPGAQDIALEVWQHRGEIRKNMHNELKVFSASIGSLLRNPILAMFEGISASRADTTELLAKLAAEKVFQVEREVYGDSDRLVPKPNDRDTETYDGHHMTPVFSPGLAIDVARSLVK